MKYLVKNNRAEVQPMVNTMSQHCKELSVSEETALDLCLVLEEILTNIIKYSYDDGLEHEIVVEIEKDAESLQFRVEDDGKPFDPTKFYNPDVEKDFDDRQIGGMGIHFIRSLTDEMRYEFTQGRNIFVVKKFHIDNLLNNKANFKEDSMSLQVSHKESRPGVFVVSPVGSIDSDTDSILADDFESIFQGTPSQIVLNMAEVSYISSAGVRVILKAKKDIKKLDGTISFINLQPQIKKVFEILNALPTFKVFSSVKEMDSYLDAMQEKFTE